MIICRNEDVSGSCVRMAIAEMRTVRDPVEWWGLCALGVLKCAFIRASGWL